MFRSQGPDCLRLIEPQECIELLRQRRFGVMALQFGVRPVDDADEPFEARLEQATPEALVPAKFKQAAWHTGIVELSLVAVRSRGPHLHHFHLAVPVRRGGYCTGMGAEA